MIGPKKTLPKWFEPVCITGFCVTAMLERTQGEFFWAYFFAVAALVFSVTAFWNKLRR